jgi:hypothetical protein
MHHHFQTHMFGKEMDKFMTEYGTADYLNVFTMSNKLTGDVRN